MKSVATKTADQLGLLALHRVRERVVIQRTSIMNRIRVFLLERGVAVRQGLPFLRIELPSNVAAPSGTLSTVWYAHIRDGERRFHAMVSRYLAQSCAAALTDMLIGQKGGC